MKPNPIILKDQEELSYREEAKQAESDLYEKFDGNKRRSRRSKKKKVKYRNKSLNENRTK